MDLTNYFIQLIDELRSVKLADKEFRRQMTEDSSLADAYAHWCEDNEYEPETGLMDFGTSYIEECESRWDSLKDYDDIQ